MRLNPKPFEMIKNGKKNIELRLYDTKRQLINIGDEIEFTELSDPARRICCKVLELHIFSSFKELYATLPLLKCGYTENDISTASPSDMELYYTPEQQQEHGVVGIELELL